MCDHYLVNNDSSNNIYMNANKGSFSQSPDFLDIEYDFEGWLNSTAELMFPLQVHPVAQKPKRSYDIVKHISENVKTGEEDDSPSKISGTGAMRKTNRFGREYICGRPLSLEVRKAICDLHRLGTKACEIATVLNITHGCVSKIVKRYNATGSVEARKIGGSHPRKSLPEVVKAIIQWKSEQPTMRTWELRDRLTNDGICDSDTLPTMSSINRIIRQNLGRFFSRKTNSYISSAGVTMNGSKDDNKELRPNASPETPPGLDQYHHQISSMSSMNEFWIDGCNTPSPSSFYEEFYTSPESANSNSSSTLL